MLDRDCKDRLRHIGGEKARAKSGLASRSHAAPSLDRWIAGRPARVAIPPNARRAYSRNPAVTPGHPDTLAGDNRGIRSLDEA